MEFIASNEKTSSGLLSTSQYKMIKSVRQTIKLITTEKGGLAEVIRNHHLNGTFSMLCDDRKMIEILYPGTSQEVMRGLPKNLREVLQWSELALDIEHIAKNADEVLRNIKRKGAEQGDIMDANTEQVLLPQIAQEALAKGIIESMRKLNRRVSSMNAKISLKVASSTSEQASYDLLEKETVTELLEAHVSEQANFYGDEWVALIRDDIARYIDNERMSSIGEDGAVAMEDNRAVGSTNNKALASMCWLEESNDLNASYPALAEAVKMIHALPYELNKKMGPEGELQLLEPSKGCTMLVRYPKDAMQRSRIDSRDDGSDRDSGIRITCSYHLVAAAASAVADDALAAACSETTSSETRNDDNSYETQNDRNSLVFTDAGASGTGTSQDQSVVRSFQIRDDWLVMHKAARLRNARTVASHEYYVLQFFIQANSKDS